MIDYRTNPKVPLTDEELLAKLRKGAGLKTLANAQRAFALVGATMTALPKPRKGFVVETPEHGTLTVEVAGYKKIPDYAYSYAMRLHVPKEQEAAARAFSEWLKTAASAKLGRQTVEEERGPDGEARARDYKTDFTIRTCPVCFRDIKATKGVMADHGYRVQWHSRQGKCPGVREKPWEVSPEGAQKFLARMIEHYEALRRSYDTIGTDGRSLFVENSRDKKMVEILPNDDRYPRVVEAQKGKIASELRMLYGGRFGGIPWYRMAIRTWTPGRVDAPAVGAPRRDVSPVDSEGLTPPPETKRWNPPAARRNPTDDPLAMLLVGRGHHGGIGAETGPKSPPRDGIAKYSSPHGSVRYLYYVAGEPVSALQIVHAPGRATTIANVYTAPSARRKGHAAKLLARARKDFGTIEHSDHLSDDGAAWKGKVGNMRTNPGPDDPATSRFYVRGRDGKMHAVWEIDARAYQAMKGVHAPWIAEISPMQYSGLSGREKKRYDEKRDREWQASADIKDEWRDLVVEAGKLGLFDPSRASESASSEAKSAHWGNVVAEDKATAATVLDAARIANADVSSLAKGDIVHYIMYGGYFVVVKVSAKSIRGYRLGGTSEGARDAKIHRGRGLDWLSSRDLEAAVAQGASTTAEFKAIAQTKGSGDTKSNPYGSHRGVRYYATAGTYRIVGDEGPPFRRIQDMRAAIDIMLDVGSGSAMAAKANPHARRNVAMLHAPYEQRARAHLQIEDGPPPQRRSYADAMAGVRRAADAAVREEIEVSGHSSGEFGMGWRALPAEHTERLDMKAISNPWVHEMEDAAWPSWKVIGGPHSGFEFPARDEASALRYVRERGLGTRVQSARMLTQLNPKAASFSPEFTSALMHFLTWQQQRIEQEFPSSRNTVGYDHGGKYAKVWRADGSMLGDSPNRSVLFFVDSTDGTVYKAASWKQKSNTRVGNVYTWTHEAPSKHWVGGVGPKTHHNPGMANDGWDYSNGPHGRHEAIRQFPDQYGWEDSLDPHTLLVIARVPAKLLRAGDHISVANLRDPRQLTAKDILGNRDTASFGTELVSAVRRGTNEVELKLGNRQTVKLPADQIVTIRELPPESPDAQASRLRAGRSLSGARYARTNPKAGDREKFEKLRAKYHDIRNQMETLRRDAHVKYGPSELTYAPKALKNKDAALSARQSKVSDEMYAILARVSPRDWSYGAPIHWVLGELTWEDAVRPTNEKLSVTPPLSYGQTHAKENPYTGPSPTDATDFTADALSDLRDTSRGRITGAPAKALTSALGKMSAGETAVLAKLGNSLPVMLGPTAKVALYNDVTRYWKPSEVAAFLKLLRRGRLRIVRQSGNYQNTAPFGGSNGFMYWLVDGGTKTNGGKRRNTALAKAPKTRAVKHAADWYTKSHWGIKPEKAIHIDDPDLPAAMTQMGTLHELEVKDGREKFVLDFTKYSPKCHVSFDPGKSRRWYLNLSSAAEADCARRLWVADGKTYTLAEVAAMTKGRHSTKRYRYPDVEGQVLGKLVRIDYHSDKKENAQSKGQGGNSIYTHKVGEEDGKHPYLMIDASGRLWICGGNSNTIAGGLKN